VDKHKAGYFENADTGTIFIDEIENIPLHIQGKLLSVLDGYIPSAALSR
jgi:two-component system nitrogen regulation response regulator GlnG